MATHASALKRQRQSEKRRLRNRHSRSQLATIIKSLKAASKKADALVIFKKVESLLAKAGQKGLLHKKTANRRISGLARLVNKLTA